MSPVAPQIERWVQQAAEGALVHPTLRTEIWTDRLATTADTPLVLLGDGQHTRWLQRAFNDMNGRVRAVADDRAHGPQRAPDQVPRVPLEDLPAWLSAQGLTDACRLLPSSDHQERALLARASELGLGDLTLPVYTDRPAMARALAAWQAEHAENAPPARAELGLPEDRSWLGAFNDCLSRKPSWCTWHPTREELLLLWDLLEAARPHQVVEVGTASGVSTALLAAGLAALPTDRPRTLTTIDLLERCPFDPDVPTGAAADVMRGDADGEATWPDVQRWAPATAADASAHLPPTGIDLAFIDANHAHPHPVVDLLALLPRLKPGAWVALHDIDMPADTFGAAEAGDGPGRLYRGWPFRKTRTEPTPIGGYGMGALQVPPDLRDAAAACGDVLLGTTPIPAGADTARGAGPGLDCRRS